ncbi:CoA pyrophosphatase [Bacillus sp. DNRA2]|uniref:NUDIX hydrolase n=1 Tax=Bacillus sp. DNRA2 TaxID=2723053 RepID=UPI00145E7FC3|nr:CoA pyrophosphatase [Bacillus sp. DNRA2]NMD71170.1 CoA pyrophosphatase [Bacillus sp. DNRA2]
MEIEKILKKLESRQASMLDTENYSKFAVLLPLIEKEDGYHILFEVRAYNMRRQPGEICFPGGRIDPGDVNEQYTAIRETSEELGISPENVRQVVPLNYMVNALGRIIYPFAGVIENVEQIKPNESEVAEVFTVPVEFFQKYDPEVYKVHLQAQPEREFPFDLIIGGENYNWHKSHIDEYFYKYEDRVIWGLTARILHHFLELIQAQ